MTDREVVEALKEEPIVTRGPCGKCACDHDQVLTGKLAGRGEELPPWLLERLYQVHRARRRWRVALGQWLMERTDGHVAAVGAETGFESTGAPRKDVATRSRSNGRPGESA